MARGSVSPEDRARVLSTVEITRHTADRDVISGHSGNKPNVHGFIGNWRPTRSRYNRHHSHTGRAMPGDMLLSSTPSCSRALEDLYFAFSASDAGGVSRLTGGLVRVPDTLLVQRLAELRRLQRRHGFRLDLDSSSEALIRAFLAESGELSAARGDQGLALTSTEVSLALKTNGFRRELTREQIRDVGRLAALGNGANFSVPGAGKTTALLAVHELVRQQEAPDMKLLVVAPRNAFISWDEEIAECLGWDATMVRLTGGRQRIAAALRLDPRIVGSPQQLPSVLADVEAYARRNRVHVVLDESHRAKGGRAAVQGAAVLALAPLAARRDILCTAMPQGLADLVPQFDFLWPGHSGVLIWLQVATTRWHRFAQRMSLCRRCSFVQRSRSSGYHLRSEGLSGCGSGSSSASSTSC